MRCTQNAVEKGSLVEINRGPDGIMTVEMRDTLGKNALSDALVGELLDALAEAGSSAGVTVVVLVGLPEVFSCGANLEILEALVSGSMQPADLRVTGAVLDVPVPVIAAMEGHAIGGGLALGLAADIAVIARESRYGCSFMNMGFTPGMGLTRLLESVMSRSMAHEMLYTGEPKRGAELQGKSGFNYILPRGEVRAKALDLAGRIADKPRRALETLKRVLSVDKRRAFEETRTVEALMHTISFAQPGIEQRIRDNYVR